MHKNLVWGIFFTLVIILFSLSATATIVLEDVDVVITGRCRSVYEFNGLHIGRLAYCGIGIESSCFENANLYTSKGIYRNLDNCVIFMHNTSGLYFWNQFVPFCIRLIPPRVFVVCHADVLFINGEV